MFSIVRNISSICSLYSYYNFRTPHSTAKDFDVRVRRQLGHVKSCLARYPDRTCFYNPRLIKGEKKPVSPSVLAVADYKLRMRLLNHVKSLRGTRCSKLFWKPLQLHCINPQLPYIWCTFAKHGTWICNIIWFSQLNMLNILSQGVYM